MNLTPLARRHDQPVRLGTEHGYRFDGDQVFINADLSVPPYLSGGAWSLELWACDAPHTGGPLSGVKVGELELHLPTPLVQHVHHVEQSVPAHLPAHGPDRAMVLALVERGADGRRILQDFANYGRRQSFAAPHLEGTVGYAIDGAEVELTAEGVLNARPFGNLSGSLRLELWALPVGDGAGECLAIAELPRLAGQERVAPLRACVPFSEPSPGHWRLALRLGEWTQAHGYVTRDQRLFASLYERSTPVVAAPVAALADAPSVAPPAPPVAAAPSAPEPTPRSAAPVVELPLPGARRAVSINSASAEELAKVKGLNLKLAREIVNARPFSSLSELLKVRGIGDKTLQRLKSLLKL